MVPLVKVTWTDSGASLHGEGSSWEDIDSFVQQARANKMTVVTVGFLIHEDDRIVIVALSYDPHHNAYVSAHQIWKPAIQSIRVIEEAS